MCECDVGAERALRQAPHGTRRCGYDAIDHLIDMQEGGWPLATCQYGALGRRVRKTFDGCGTHFAHAGLWLSRITARASAARHRATSSCNRSMV